MLLFPLKRLFNPLARLLGSNALGVVPVFVPVDVDGVVDGKRLLDWVGFNLRMELSHPTTLVSSPGQQSVQHFWISVGSIEAVWQDEIHVEHFAEGREADVELEPDGLVLTGSATV